jgi:hypothetical protein
MPIETEEDKAKRGQRDSPRTPAKEQLPGISTTARISSPLQDMEGGPDGTQKPRLPSERHAPPLPMGGSVETMPQTADEKLDKIMAMMEKVAAKEDLALMEKSVLKEVEARTKQAVSEAVDPLKTELYDLKLRVEGLEAPGQLPQAPNSKTEDAQAKAEAAHASIKELRKEFVERFSNMTASHQTTPVLTARETMVVVGGLGDDFDDANRFIAEEVSTRKLHVPSDSFFKGDQFKGIMFLKYNDVSEANEVVRKLSQVKVQHAGRQIWCKIDLPVEERTSLGFILGLRRLLISWGFDRRNLKVQDEVPMLSVGGSPVASASVANNALEIKWSEESWKTWGDLTGSLEYKNLVDDANKRVKQSAESRKKGGGKGYKGPRV